MKSPKPATDTIYPHIKFWWYRTMLNFYPPFLCRVIWQPFWKWQTSWKFILLFFPRTMNLSTADLRNYWTEFRETWWSYRYMFLVDPKVFRFVVNGVKVIFFNYENPIIGPKYPCLARLVGYHFATMGQRCYLLGS
jgi:hypothetical protein